MKPRFSIEVLGIPRPQGSKKAVGNRTSASGKLVPILRESSRHLAGWRSTIRARLAEMTVPTWPQHAPVRCDLVFTFVRPAGHTGTTGKLRKAGRSMPAPTGKTTGDIEKLIRAIHDELSMIHDDSQISCVVARKVWGDREGVRIRLYDACPECGRAVEAGLYHVCDPD